MTCLDLGRWWYVHFQRSSSSRFFGVLFDGTSVLQVGGAVKVARSAFCSRSKIECRTFSDPWVSCDNTHSISVDSAASIPQSSQCNVAVDTNLRLILPNEFFGGCSCSERSTMNLEVPVSVCGCAVTSHYSNTQLSRSSALF